MADRTLKLVSYNILDGGLGRLDPIYETLLYLAPDVVGLCEADDPKSVRYLGDKLGMEYVMAEGQAGRAVALLTRFPLRRMVNLCVDEPLLDRGAMEAVIELDGQALRLALVHLRAGQSRQDEEVRLQQIDRLLSALEAESMPTVLMGDLNAAAPYHPFDYEAASPKLRQRLDERGVRGLDHDVVRHMMSRGWVDAYHHRSPVEPKHTYTTGFPCARFDYIWVSPDLERYIAEADIEQGGFAPYCSDHYPIWAMLGF